MESRSKIQPYSEREKAPEDRDAERHLQSAFRLVEALNAMLNQTRGQRTQDSQEQLWPVQSILNEIALNLATATSHFCAPSTAELDAICAQAKAESADAWAKFQAREQ